MHKEITFLVKNQGNLKPKDEIRIYAAKFKTAAYCVKLEVALVAAS